MATNNIIEIATELKGELITLIFNLDKPIGYIDVGDGCWGPNVLVSSLRCW